MPRSFAFPGRERWSGSSKPTSSRRRLRRICTVFSECFLMAYRFFVFRLAGLSKSRSIAIPMAIYPRRFGCSLSPSPPTVVLCTNSALIAPVVGSVIAWSNSTTPSKTPAAHSLFHSGLNGLDQRVKLSLYSDIPSHSHTFSYRKHRNPRRIHLTNEMAILHLSLSAADRTP